MLLRNMGDIYMGDLPRDHWALQNCELWGRKETKAGARGTGS